MDRGWTLGTIGKKTWSVLETFNVIITEIRSRNPLEKASRSFAKQMQSTPIKITVLKIGLNPEQLKEYDHVIKYQLGKESNYWESWPFRKSWREKELLSSSSLCSTDWKETLRCLWIGSPRLPRHTDQISSPSCCSIWRHRKNLRFSAIVVKRLMLTQLKLRY